MPEANPDNKRALYIADIPYENPRPDKSMFFVGHYNADSAGEARNEAFVRIKRYESAFRYTRKVLIKITRVYQYDKRK